MRTALFAAGFGALFFFGCASTRIDRDELPAEPIALVYRSPEEGRQLAELFQKAEERREEQERQQGRAAAGVNVLELAKLGHLVDRRSPLQRLRELQGRVSLFFPGNEERTPIDAMLRGARPLQWSRDRDRLLVMSPRRGEPQIFELSLADGEVRPLTHGAESYPFAGYGPDRRLVLGELRKGAGGVSMRLLLTGPEGHAPEPFTEGPFDTAPAWHPDGSVVVFATQQAGGLRSIAVKGVGAGAQPRVIARGGEDPVFTPDGEWIVYSAKTRDGYRLWRMRPDGSGKTRLGRGRNDERNPAVSPDGRFVAYIADESGRQRLRVRRFDGTGDRLVLDDGDGAYPVW